MADKKVIALELTLDSAKGEESVKTFKQRLREANQELFAMAEKFGETSKEAANAAKKVALLKDTMGDAKALSETFNPDKKFVALGSAIQGATAGFSAFNGMMGLVGDNSKETEALLLKVQSAMALQQGLSGIAGSIDAFKLLGSTIKNQVIAAFSTLKGAVAATGIGLLAVGVGYLIANFDKLKTSLGFASEAQKGFNETLEDYKKGAQTAIEKTNTVKVAFDQAKEGVIGKDKALKIYNETLGDTFGKATSLAQAEDLYNKKASTYITVMGLKAQANALFAKSAEEAAKGITAEQVDQTSSFDKLYASVKASLFNVGKASLELNQKNIEGVKAAKKTAEENAKEYFKRGEEIATNAENLAKTQALTIDKIETEKGDKKLKKVEDVGKKEIELVRGFLKDRLNAIEDADSQEMVSYDNAALLRSDDLKARNAYNQQWMDAENETEVAYSEMLKGQAEARKTIARTEKEQRIQLAQDTAMALGALSDVIGKETTAGKALAVAQALINTYQGISKGVSMGMPWGIPSIIAASATGFKAVKDIIAVKIPGKSSGGSAPNLSTTIAPLQPQAQTTALDQNSINSIGNAASRSFVLESDITGSQERIRRINRLARIN
jgi:hypothetical protein